MELTLDRVSENLDEIEERLPPLPAAWLHLNRTMFDAMLAQQRRSNERLTNSFSNISSVASAGNNTVLGTARWAAERTAKVATTGVRQVTGQLKAQGGRTVSTISGEATEMADKAASRIEATDARAQKRHLKTSTKSELYEKACELDIDGRSKMSKAQLVNALVGADS